MESLPDFGVMAHTVGVPADVDDVAVVQDVGELSGRSVMAEVLSGAGRVSGLGEELKELEHRMSDPEGEGLGEREMERYGEAQSEFLHLGGYELETRAQTILTGLGISKERWDDPVESFSGGWKMRVALAKILLLNPAAY